ncbi:MAG: DUF3135 domain-containing protein [Pseudomonadota bacterium]
MSTPDLPPPVAMPDFDELATLARDNPEAFEQLRSELLEQCVQCAPPRMHRRLRGLVFELDAQRQTSQSPLAACLDASGRMWKSFDELRVQLNAVVRPEALSEEELASLKPNTQSADVLPFARSERSAR